MESLFKKAEESGIEIRYETPAVKIEKENNSIKGIYVRK